MDKQVKRKIRDAFYSYHERLKTGLMTAADFAERNMAVQYDKVSVKSSGGLSKEEQLCSVLDKQSKSDKWVIVVQKVLDYYKWDYKETIIKYKYFRRWNNQKLCNELHLSDRTLRYWDDEILMKAEMWAKEFKLL